MKRSLYWTWLSFLDIKEEKEKSACMWERKTGQITLALVEMESKIRGQCVYSLTERNIMSVKHTREAVRPNRKCHLPLSSQMYL